MKMKINTISGLLRDFRPGGKWKCFHFLHFQKRGQQKGGIQFQSERGGVTKRGYNFRFSKAYNLPSSGQGVDPPPQQTLPLIMQLFLTLSLCFRKLYCFVWRVGRLMLVIVFKHHFSRLITKTFKLILYWYSKICLLYFTTTATSCLSSQLGSIILGKKLLSIYRQGSTVQASRQSKIMSQWRSLKLC